jgi:hypothetical protein
MRLIFITIFFFSSLLFATEEGTDRIRTLIQIEHTKGTPKIFVIEKNAFVPSIPANEEVKGQLLQLAQGSQAIVEGRVHFEASGIENQRIRPYFIIEKILPVSLEDLGTDARSYSLELQKPMEWSPSVYTPSTIPVTTEVASAITLTTGLLLFEELSAGENTPKAARDQQRALLLSTGTFATLLFIYEQIKGKSKP